jgi:hypothetical protein
LAKGGAHKSLSSHMIEQFLFRSPPWEYRMVKEHKRRTRIARIF